jgi:hypothetical protein
VSRESELASERRELWRLAGGLAAAALVLHFLFGAVVLPLILATLSSLALLGATAFRRCGHDVHLVFSLLAHLIGRVISWLMVALTYALAIALLGSAIRIFGMNKLDRDFRRCRQKPTMLVDAPHTSLDSFTRQS